mmetsp:Transcript_752/g.1394  ORF Transcript_752/g.1394 Transcript_752/m.1394 type:complete len:378 (-) Transcript_752:758-1891(-)|eukprot:CAMPEP_0202495080 /NCGR_PEP_ID=MMETSP1361-20130828/15034_1 /ASSEMBLY_ACC=CAM_ASM_000849 /TAXON_ID=210615 /ORGANISM="Staurosira complex sp., Strain CCMP2646" /LENGTH=377 /DNA_ID=CAMNT_0049125941 /DNA_START=21 /DNA_END=1154 /DNA_ORIENTATION=-
MSRKQHYTKPVVATIDLHGYKRDEGIAAVTAFVESSQRHQFPPPSTTTDAWICIITGSGHHSPSGPVLRDAVQSLLNKREMEYTLQRGKGSFLVNVHSGHALVAAPAMAKCTKIQIVNNNNNNTNNNPHSDVKLVNRSAMRSSSTNATRSIETTTTTTTSVAAPKPAEVAADDVLVERVKQESHRQFIALQKRSDEMQLKQALMASKREIEQQAQREQECLLAAILKQSQQEEELLHAQEQERLEEILRHSREEEERMQRLEQEQLNEILRISQQQQEEENSQDELLERVFSLSQLQIHNNHDDEQLNQALQQSLHDVHATDEEFHRALSLSLQECNQDESVSIHNKASSPLELSITESTTIEMLQEQVGYVIEEVD